MDSSFLLSPNPSSQGAASPLPFVQPLCLVLLGVRKIGEEEERRERRKEGVDPRREIKSMSSP
jgi:hypothetical protein